MKSRYIYRGSKVVAVYRDGEEVYRDPEFMQASANLHHVMPDIQPYRSMIDGRIISSRSTHREHLRANGCVEVGDQTHYLKQKPVETPKGLKETVARIAYEKLKY